MSSLGPVVVNLPDPARAPGYRASLTDLSQFAVQDFGGSVAVAPREGAGATRNYFRVHRLCGAGETVTPETWEPLRQHPARDAGAERRRRLLDYADQLAAAPATDLPRQLRALRARVMALGNELPAFLQEHVPRLFAGLPGASLWFVSVDDVLLARFAFLRAQLALKLTPDIPLNPKEFAGLRALVAHSITAGADFGRVHDPVLLAFSPDVAAFSMSCMPHALVLFLGEPLELRQHVEESLPALYRPGVLDRAGNWDDPPFRQGLTHAEVESLLPWWVERLNVLYSHATDPTRFSDQLGHHDPAAQTAWHLTFERMLTDGILLLSDPSASDIVRTQLAFDLLDKAESLLGYSRSGPGFKQLLRRSAAVPRLNQAWESLPGGLPKRFRRHTRVVFDSMYDDIREHALDYRRTKRGMLVSFDDPSKPRPMAMEDYVSRLLRAVRNSAHGLSRPLRAESGMLLATHDGEMPTQLADVAKLVLLALVADAEKLSAGAWW